MTVQENCAVIRSIIVKAECCINIISLSCEWFCGGHFMKRRNPTKSNKIFTLKIHVFTNMSILPLTQSPHHLETVTKIFTTPKMYLRNCCEY